MKAEGDEVLGPAKAEGDAVQHAQLRVRASIKALDESLSIAA